MDRRKILLLWWRYSRFVVIAVVAAAIGFAAIMALGFILRSQFMNQVAGDNSVVSGDEVVTEGPTRDGGQDFDFYVGKKFRPNTAEKAMEVPYLALIAERQDQQVLPIASGRVILDSENIDELVRDFLIEWETFDPTEESQADYGRRLAKFVLPTSQNKVYDRVENHQTREIGWCDDCSGSQLRLDLLDPLYYVQLHAKSDEQMYVTAQALVSYTGRAENLNLAVYRRSYGIVVKRYNDQWRIARVAADTLQKETGF